MPARNTFKKSQGAIIRSRRRGSTLIEFALIVPILVTMLLGIIEFGWLVKNLLTIANATREGARTASLGKTISTIRDRVKNSAKPIIPGIINHNLFVAYRIG